MPRIPLISEAYAGRSIISSGQECVNLYAEIVGKFDPQAPVPITYYPTPGTVLKAQSPNNAPVRGVYRTSAGTAYMVSGVNVFYIAPDYTLILIGTVADKPTQIYFKDNGIVVVLVDGSNGYIIEMASNRFKQIVDPNFYGSAFVELIDTFFIFNNPGTNQFYISASNANWGLFTNSSVDTGSLVGTGSGYVNGSYNNVPLTYAFGGGTGVGATANIIISGNAVSSLVIVNPGQDYVIGDILSANASDLGGSVTIGFGWQIVSMLSAFDPLDIAAKSGFNDPIVSIVSVHRELWLVGNLTSEVWIGTGAADFYFQQVQGAFINHGSAAPYSIASQDTLVFFIQQDMQGNGLVLQGQGYDVQEISTPRIVKEFKSYAQLSDAIGFCFQIADHAFYALVFPTASKGWLYDLTSSQWSEWNWADDNGILKRPRANCCMFAFGAILVGDWENGKLLQLSVDDLTDEGLEITRIRTFPHLVDNDGYARVNYSSFDADMEVGTTEDLEAEPEIFLSWSDDKGRTYGNPVAQSMGKTGEYLTTISWNRLGQARDRVFKLQWSTDNITALNGGFTEINKART